MGRLFIIRLTLAVDESLFKFQNTLLVCRVITVGPLASCTWVYRFPACIIVQFSHSVVSNSLQPMDCSTSGFPVHHQLLGLTHIHVHWVGNAIQSSHPLLSTSHPTFNLSQHQGLFKWVSSSHQMAKLLELQLQHQSFQWIFRTDFL